MGMMSGLESPTHILFVLIVAVLVFGPKRLPEVGRSLGAGIREFRDSFSGGDRDKGSDS
jgi:sec-independent protein translocase protein TatA